MDPEIWKDVNRVLDDVEALEGEAREARLLELCAGDRVVEQEVRNLMEDLRACPGEFLGADGGACVVGEGQILGDFRLIRKLGAGGGGTVYEAQQISLDRRVALKVRSVSAQDMSPQMQAAEQRRMRREAVVAGRLSHPGIAAIHGFGQVGEHDWIAMELVEGHDLDTEIVRQAGQAKRGKGPIMLPGVGEEDFLASRLELVRDVALALHAAHETGVIHRDVKPANIMVQECRTPKLVDFGLAHGPSLLEVTLPEMIAGSVYFMSPEQTRGELLDRRTDVYSLGCVLFQLTTGQLPFPGTQVQKVLRQIQRGPTPLPSKLREHLGADLDAVCAKAMRLEAGSRYATTLEFAEDLGRLLAGEPVRARRLTPTYRVYCWTRRHRKALGWVALGAGLVGLAGYLVQQRGQAAGRSERVGVQLDSMGERTRASILAGNIAPLAGIQVELDQLAKQGELSGVQGERAASTRQAIEGYAESKVANLDAQLSSILGVESILPQDERALLAALSERHLVEGLLPAEGRTLGGSTNVFPVLSVRAGQVGDRISVHPSIPISGEFQATPVGEFDFPMQGQGFAPGAYRIRVTRPGVGFAELTRWLGEWGRAYPLGAFHVRATAEVVADMALVPAGEQELVLPIRVGNGDYERRSFAHGAFYMDRSEVSNADYLDFLNANPELNKEGALEPYLWRFKSNDAAWLDRPVVGVSWMAARSFAEWAGKRLPTQVEWAAAMSGAEGRSFPWGEDASWKERVVLPEAEAIATPSDARGKFELYMRFTHPVDEITIDITPNPQAIMHLAGNASEWTDSMALGAIGGRLHPLVTHRASKGWSALRAHPKDLRGYEEVHAEIWESSILRGFRCAKSAL